MIDLASVPTAFAILGVGVVVGILAAAMLRRLRRGRSRHRRGHDADEEWD